MFNFQNYNKGTKYLQNRNFEKAVQFLKREIAINEFKECYLNLGNAYKGYNNFEKAGECYLKAMNPNLPFANGRFGEYDLALSNYGLYVYANGDDDKAMEYYNRALELNPQLMDAIWNYASAILRKHCSNEEVDLASAWGMYEFRFKRNNPVAVDRSVMEWNGIDRVNTILVAAEQGFGDKLMWGRYINCLKDYCNRLIVQCPDTMNGIFSEWETTQLSAAEVGADRVVPICSLSRHFMHLTVNGEWLAGKYNGDLIGKFEDLNVGIEWSGSVTHSNNANRSVGVERFLNLKVDGVKLFSFKDKGPKGIEYLKCVPDWEKTAKTLVGLDLLVTVDTSIAHLAGSMGIKTLLMQPSIETDFRWGNDKMGTKNIWYPSIEVIRNPGNWDKVFAKVRERLIEERDIKQKCVQANHMAALLEAKENNV